MEQLSLQEAAQIQLDVGKEILHELMTKSGIHELPSAYWSYEGYRVEQYGTSIYTVEYGCRGSRDERIGELVVDEDIINNNLDLFKSKFRASALAIFNAERACQITHIEREVLKLQNRLTKFKGDIE